MYISMWGSLCSAEKCHLHYPHRHMAGSSEGCVCTFSEAGGSGGRHLRGYLQQQHEVLLEEAQRARRLSAGPYMAPGPFQFSFSHLSCLSIFDVSGGQGGSLIPPYTRKRVSLSLCVGVFVAVP